MKRPINTVVKIFDANGEKKEKETITIAELRKLKEAVVTDDLDLTAPSVMNKAFTKADVIENLFGILDENLADDTEIHYMTFENILREFVIGRKRIDNSWKEKELI